MIKQNSVHQYYLQIAQTVYTWTVLLVVQVHCPDQYRAL
jgi:hypothetical protein